MGNAFVTVFVEEKNSRFPYSGLGTKDGIFESRDGFLIVGIGVAEGGGGHHIKKKNPALQRALFVDGGASILFFYVRNACIQIIVFVIRR